jgi:hypothetical protein
MSRALLFSASILLLGGSATAAPTDNPAALSQDQASQAILDMAMAQIMRPGPKREDWNKGGADLHSIAQAAPGGSTRNFILSIDKDGDRSLMISGATDPSGFVPADWHPVYRTGSGVSGGEPTDVTFGHLDGQSYFAGMQARKRVGDAYCSTGGMVGVLYKNPKPSTPSELPKGAAEALYSMMVKRLEKQTICWRYDPDGDSYKVSHYLEDGQSLPALDEAGFRVRLVPAAPVDQLLAQPSKAK